MKSFALYITRMMLAIIGAALLTSLMLALPHPVQANYLPFATIVYCFASLTISSILTFFLVGYRTTSTAIKSHRSIIIRLCVFILNTIAVAAMTFSIFSVMMFLTHDGHRLKLQMFDIGARYGLIDTIDQAYDLLFNLVLFLSLLTSSVLAWLCNLFSQRWTVIYSTTSQRA